MLDDIKNSTDLANLKERINNCSDEELAAAMEEEWLHGIIPDSGISDEDLARIKAEIHEQIGTHPEARPQVDPDSGSYCPAYLHGDYGNDV